MSEPPEQAVWLLRAKAAELENYVESKSHGTFSEVAPRQLAKLAADIALVAQLLADHIEAGDVA